MRLKRAAADRLIRLRRSLILKYLSRNKNRGPKERQLLRALDF